MKIKKIFFFLAFFICCASNAQNNAILKRKLQNYTIEDTTKCFLLDRNIEAENDENVWIKYNQELKKIAQNKSQTETNPLLKKTYIKYLSIAFNNEGAFYVYTEEYEKAIEYYKKALKISHKITYNYGTSLALQNIGTAFDYLGKIDSTLFYMEKAFHYAKISKNEGNLAYILTDLGYVHNTLGNNALAIKYNLQALPLFEKLKDEEGLERTYFSLGRIFDNQNDFKTSNGYYTKCLVIDKKTNNFQRLTLVLNSLAATNVKLNKIDLAKVYNDQAFKLSLKSNNIDLLASSYKIYGDIFFAKNEFEKSKFNYLKAYELFKKINSDVYLTKTAIKIATVSVQLNDLKTAKEYGLIGYDLSKKTNYPWDQKDASEILSQIYFNLNDYKNAYQFKTIASDIGQKIYFDESKDIALKATFQYETEKKEAQIKELSQKKKISELESNKKTILINSFIISFIALSVIAYFLFSRFKTKKKNELLETKLEEAEKLLEAEKKATDSELKALKSQMNPHFIFNALNSIQAQFMYGDKIKANEQLNNFTYLTRQILEVSGKKQIPIATEIEILTKYLDLEKMRFAKDFEYEITVSKAIDEDYHKIPPMLLQPFVENSIKHGLMHKTGLKTISIKFDIDTNENYFICTIEDNGIGREKSARIKANNPTQHTSFSTQSIQERLAILNEKLQLNHLITYSDVIENNVISGTKVVINVPLI